MIQQLDDLILDDDGVRRLLKFPPGQDLGYYRDRAGLPYLRFRVGGDVVHRYVTGAVLDWLTHRQHNGAQDADE